MQHTRMVTLLLIIPFVQLAKAQPGNNMYTQAESLQIASYKPAKAKPGKNGNERIVLIQISKGPKSGSRGKDGQPGAHLFVNIASVTTGDSNLLKVVVTNKNIADTYFVNPRRGQLKIIANGGDGGAGGRGETGAADGIGGNGGDGGSIEIIVDSSAIAYASCPCLIYSNKGGIGGWNGDREKSSAPAGKIGPDIFIKTQSGKILRTVGNDSN